MAIADRRELYKAIDELPDERLPELASFIEYLLYKAKRPEGSAWLKEVYDAFAPVREEADDMGLTEESINQLIDEAIEEVRREQD